MNRARTSDEVIFSSSCSMLAPPSETPSRRSLPKSVETAPRKPSLEPRPSTLGKNAQNSCELREETGGAPAWVRANSVRAACVGLGRGISA
jgi:hypothetical protein